MLNHVFKTWGFVTITCLATAIAMSKLSMFKPTELFNVMCVILFAAMSLLLITAGKRALRSNNNYAFVNVVMGYMTGKLFICAIAIFIYAYMQRPHVYFFLIPAGLFYTVYTIFEIRAMSILQKEK